MEEEARRLQEELEEARIRMAENQIALQEALAPPPPPPPAPEPVHQSHIQENDHDEGEDGSGTGGAELEVNEYEEIPRPEEDRLTQQQKDKKMQEQLKALSAELKDSKDQTRVTRNDLLHQDNVSKGRDKYKTLKQIRQGNTKQRVDMFEAM